MNSHLLVLLYSGTDIVTMFLYLRTVLLAWNKICSCCLGTLEVPIQKIKLNYMHSEGRCIATALSLAISQCLSLVNIKMHRMLFTDLIAFLYNVPQFCWTSFRFVHALYHGHIVIKYNWWIKWIISRYLINVMPLKAIPCVAIEWEIMYHRTGVFCNHSVSMIYKNKHIS